jgi:hypothetical protein
MYPAEVKFREVEQQLDMEIQSVTPVFLKYGIFVEDTSSRTYHYKVDHLLWERALKREWEINLQTIQVSVRISYYEPVTVNEQPEILVNWCAEKFYVGQESSFKQKSESKYSLSALLENGIDTVIIQQFKSGAQVVGQAL